MTIAVTASQPGQLAAASALAAELGLPLLDQVADARALLALTPERLELAATGPDAPGAIAVDFTAGALRHRRRGGHNEPLGRAVGVGKWQDISVVDATAGLGRDSFVLADLGCQVTLLEREPVVFALLRDGIERGQRSEDPWVAEVCQRMTLVRADAREWLAGAAVDVVYLDPMFPARRKSARVKKDMWLFQQLLEPADVFGGLLEAALAAAGKRVVVKRPAKAPALGERAPAFQLPGKTVRFDVYLPEAGI
ncbi:MAG: class I SAM-dependent methyltransferase [Halieaceae bacterium]|nr:class I SAM-dependent methyltransferase [Halieaceae bacterium]